MDPGADNAAFEGAVQDAALSFSNWSLAPGLGPFGSPVRVIAPGTFPTVPGSDLVSDVDLADPTGTLANYSFIALQLTSKDPAFFSPAALPLDPPTLAQIDPFGLDPATLFGYGSELFLGGGGPLGNVSMHAELTSLVRVPEPGIFAERGVNRLRHHRLERRLEAPRDRHRLCARGADESRGDGEPNTPANEARPASHVKSRSESHLTSFEDPRVVSLRITDPSRGSAASELSRTHSPSASGARASA